MKVERRDVKYLMWRKKVDMVLLEKLHTPIPNWLSEAWNIKGLFGAHTSKNRPEAKVSVKLAGRSYDASIAYAKYQDKDPAYKIWLSKDLSAKLKDLFVMSYMRSIELRLRKAKKKREPDPEKAVQIKVQNIEEEIPFWEFLDIEFNSRKKELIFTAHYFQKPIFPELFKAFIQSHILRTIENNIADKHAFKFIKEDWKPREQLSRHLERTNIIYYLIDTTNKLLYIGEGDSTTRIGEKHDEISNWDHYRIECLPNILDRQQRLELERLIIRSYAAIISNSKEIKHLKIGDYQLVNKKIDD